MKTYTQVLLLLISLLFSSQIFSKNQQGTMQNKPSNTNNTTNVPQNIGGSAQTADSANLAEELTHLEVHHLLYMREEEKLARDVYFSFYEEFGNAIFINISDSEQVHTDKIRDLLFKYDIEDPMVDNSVGAYSDPVFTDLFNQLMDSGMSSELDALLVGGLIEEIDIFDIQESIADTTHSDIIQTYENLMKGSRNHLRSFAAVIEKRTGAPYVAQFLSQEEVDSIVNSSMEIGR